VQDKIEEESTDGGQMCLPVCADRTYTSNATHIGLFISFACFAGLFISALLVLILSPLITKGEAAQQTKLVNTTLGITGVGVLSAISAGLFFFCGTKKSNQEDVKVKNQLIPLV